MPKSKEEAINKAKEIIADELEYHLKQEATKAIGAHDIEGEINRTGHLVRNIKVKPVGNELLVSMPKYGIYLEYGTGLYGPKKQLIRPKNAEVLHWESNGEDIFATYTRGMTPAPFIRPTFHSKFIEIVVKALNKAFKGISVNDL